MMYFRKIRPLGERLFHLASDSPAANAGKPSVGEIGAAKMGLDDQNHRPDPSRLEK